jgi:hypothetical protein
MVPLPRVLVAASAALGDLAAKTAASITAIMMIGIILLRIIIVLLSIFPLLQAEVGFSASNVN